MKDNSLLIIQKRIILKNRLYFILKLKFVIYFLIIALQTKTK